MHGVRQALFPIDDASWGCLQLIDFGLSKHLQSAHTLGVGTPDYMYVLRYGGVGYRVYPGMHWMEHKNQLDKT